MGKPKEKLKTSRMLANNLLMLKYVGKFTPGLIIFYMILMIVTALSGVLNRVYIATTVLNAVQENKTIQDLIPFIVGAIALNLLMVIMQSFYNGSYFPQKKEILFKKMHGELFLKAKDMEISCYDTPKFYNDFVWAMGEAHEKALSVLETLGNFVKYLTSIVSIIAIIASVDYWGVIVALIIVVFAYVARLAINRIEYEMEIHQKPLQRRRDYTSRILYQPDYAKEVRLNPVKDKLIQNFSKTNKELIDTIRHYSLKTLKWDFLCYTVANTLLIDMCYLGYLLYMTIVKNAFTYGGFYALYSGTSRLKNSLQGMIYEFTTFHRHSLYIERFRTFIEYVPQMEEPQEPQPMSEEAAELCFENVSFCYDSLKKPTLKNITLKIAPGEKIALVGYNGAGKSTLIKLIMRLYDASEGQIKLGDKDIKDYSIPELRQYFGVVFQDYQLFAATVGENVKMDCVDKKDEPMIKEALKHSGFVERLDTLKNGTKTVLTREFDKDGINLSGGEAQKVAIARIFPRDCKMVILDEPSSALDPISEYNVNQSMLEAAKDKTVVFISHRLSTTRNADRIIMLANGEIIEEGSHDELMELNGKYAEMFLLQAEKYRQEQAG